MSYYSKLLVKTRKKFVLIYNVYLNFTTKYVFITANIACKLSNFITSLCIKINQTINCKILFR